jgi:DNA-binding NtrC family response regulator
LPVLSLAPETVLPPKRATVLVVEDDEDQLAIRCLLIGNAGFEAVAAGNGRTAMSLADALQPRCAVVDLHLPTKELGMKLVKSLTVSVPGIRILLLSGHNWQGKQPDPTDLGVYAILQKGCSARLMLQKVREAIAAPA